MAESYAAIVAISDGQPTPSIRMPYVYITEDKSDIVIDEIHYEIYSPDKEVTYDEPTFVNVENWHTIYEYTMTNTEFSAAKAILGFDFSVPESERKEITNTDYYWEHYNNNKYAERKTQHTLMTENPASGSQAANRAVATAAVFLAMDIVKALASGVTQTYLTFFFQKTEAGKHRVLILGGTNSDYIKYYNYSDYGRERSFLYDILPEGVIRQKTKEEMKPAVKELLEYYVEIIENGESQAKILVDKNNLWLKDNEYYDMLIKLNRKRMCKRYYTYIYSDQKQLCQKHIIYSGESLVIAKRSGLYPVGTKINLIELINDTKTASGNTDFWKVLETVLQSDETCSKLLSMGDEIPADSKPQQVQDLIKR